MMLVIASLSFTSCKQLEVPANIERIGSGYIKQEKGICFIEIDSVMYVPRYIYTNKSGRDGKQEMQPVDGMLVTVFRINNDPDVEFIIGNQSEEYLETYFTTSNVGFVLIGILVILLIALIIWKSFKTIEKGPISRLEH